MGITSDTPTNLVVGAGNGYLDNADVGATTEDNVFTVEREIFTPELNGAKGALLGTDYITKSEGVLAMSLPEFDETILAATWPGSTAVGTGTVQIDEDDTRRIPTADYHDWELQIERLGGGEFQFEVDNAIHTGSLEATLGDASMAAPRIEARSRWDPADLTVSPHRIRILDVAS
jgi:hypothetical protein